MRDEKRTAIEPRHNKQDSSSVVSPSNLDMLDSLAGLVADRLQIGDVIRAQNKVLLEEYTGMRPLLSVKDVAKTLNISTRSVETLIAQSKLRPLWIKGQRRFHPDVVAAYIRSCEVRKRRRKKKPSRSR